MGPIIIFDKSALESLNPDEAVWLDQFFISNITPLFYIETLADLRKEPRGGRTPEQIVGSLAYKTPDMNAQPNVHHSTLVAGELLGRGPVDMRYGRPIISGGRTVKSEGKRGVVFEPSPEQRALERWQAEEFLEVEREQAAIWREGLSLLAPADQRARFQPLIENNRPKDLVEVKSRADAIIDQSDQKFALSLGLAIEGVAPAYQKKVMARWEREGKPPVREFAPYFRHVFGVDLFFYLGIAADQISERRTNRVDIAYLYYLPFCMVFTSKDNLHLKTVPLFLGENQVFVPADDLKADLRRLDRLYSLVPDDIQEKGLMHFASEPPKDDGYLVTQLWDRFLPRWRELSGKNEAGRDPKLDAETVAYLKRLAKAPSEQAPEPANTDAMNYMIVKRRVRPRKGKWNRFSREVANAKANEEPSE